MTKWDDVSKHAAGRNAEMPADLAAAHGVILVTARAPQLDKRAKARRDA